MAVRKVHITVEGDGKGDRDTFVRLIEAVATGLKDERPDTPKRSTETER